MLVLALLVLVLRPWQSLRQGALSRQGSQSRHLVEDAVTIREARHTERKKSSEM